jgi:long-chain fatty acid transport protein
MQTSSTRRRLLTGTALAALLLTGLDAQAGGFAVHEQSAYFQGSSFAGAAAGGPSISAMFWNPATMTQVRAGSGLVTESNYSAIITNQTITPTTATSAAFPAPGSLMALGGSGDMFVDAVVPASYAVWRPNNDRLAVGVAINAPFGLSTNTRTYWAGMFYARESKVFSINVTPQAAYQVTDWLSVGAGLQIEYFKVRLENAFPGAAPVGPDNFSLAGSSTDFGFTAGVTVTPTPWTQIGLGFRSAIVHSLSGEVSRPAFFVPIPAVIPAALVNIRADVTTPESLSLGIRQKVSDAFTLLGTVEWTRWSRLGTIPITYLNPVPAGTVPASLAFEWRDGWFGSVGVEYQWSPSLALRTGIAFEQSPVTDRTRGARLPDNDRTWVSAGLSYNWSNKLTFELGYSHVFVKASPINIVAGNPGFSAGLGSFTGNADTTSDIISVGMRYRWGTDPLKALITKG